MFLDQAKVDWLVTNSGGGYTASGVVAEQMVSGMKFDPGLHRPFFNERGTPCVSLEVRPTYNNATRTYHRTRKTFSINDLQRRGINSPTFNATTLRKEEWVILDQQVLRAARARLRAYSDLAAANSYGGFNGMAKMILEHETMSDPGFAQVDMDGLTAGTADTPQFQLQGLPLPITHSDFWYSSRQLAVSRNSGTPLDTTMGEAAGRRVAETIEKTTIGVTTGITYGGNSTQVGGYGRPSTVYGYTNFPNRVVYTGAYKPTGNGRSGTGWSPLDTLKDVLAMRQLLQLNNFFGPYMIYTSNDWDPYLDSDYQVFQVAGSNYGGNMTLRDRLRAIDDVQDVKRLDYFFSAAPPGYAQGAPGYQSGDNLFPFCILMIQMTPDVCRAVNALDVTTIQFQERGGLKISFVVLAIQVPQIRADFYSRSGILQASATA